MIQKRQRMNILQHFADILEVGGSSMNFIAVKKRVKDRMGELRYQTIGDSRKAMRQDVKNIRADFNKVVNNELNHVKKSRTKQD
ncbi:MAG: hypothetical protein E7082_07380 [Bacteroidales bacterium]|nr:hypothetical protein [Bacteroidales bacterium]